MIDYVTKEGKRLVGEAEENTAGEAGSAENEHPDGIEEHSPHLKDGGKEEDKDGVGELKGPSSSSPIVVSGKPRVGKKTAADIFAAVRGVNH